MVEALYRISEQDFYLKILEVLCGNRKKNLSEKSDKLFLLGIILKKSFRFMIDQLRL
jgi:hypothetical protein